MSYKNHEQPDSSPKWEKIDRDEFPDRPNSPNQNIPGTYENFCFLLDFYGIKISFNLVKKRADIEIPGVKPSIINRDEALLAHLESLCVRNRMSCANIRPYILAKADENRYDPFANWVISRPWDGVSRIDDIVRTLTPTDDYPQGLANTLIEKWLTSIVAATFERHNFRSRGVLTIQGGQGLGKTTWAGRLVTPSELRDDIVKLGFGWDGGSKDAKLIAVRHRIVELGELEGSFRREMAGLKAFITETVDKIRPPYARLEAEYPRSTIFIASVNDSHFLADATGNSRFWNISVKQVDYKHSIDMQQLFAELKIKYEAGSIWWLTEEEEQALADVNRQHRYLSAIEAKIEEALDLGRKGAPGLPRLTANEVLERLGYAKPTNAQSKEANTALKGLLGEPKRIKGQNRWFVPWLKHEPTGSEYFDDTDDDLY